VLHAHPDGSFDMQPGFSAPGRRYRFEDVHGGCGGRQHGARPLASDWLTGAGGWLPLQLLLPVLPTRNGRKLPAARKLPAPPGGIYEYSLENASRTEAPSLERRAARLGAALLGGGCSGRRGGASGGGRGERLDLGMPPAAGGNCGTGAPRGVIAAQTGLAAASSSGAQGVWSGARRGGACAAVPLTPCNLCPSPCARPADADAGALRLLLMGEIVAGAGFDRDRLYVEWRLAFDPGLWRVLGPAAEAAEAEGLPPGLLRVSAVGGA
jgi:hypothetical protein